MSPAVGMVLGGAVTVHALDRFGADEDNTDLRAARGACSLASSRTAT